MNKRVVIEAILEKLESQYESAKHASEEAAEYATHEEARAESKWDTQGLEASYLAAGQAAQVSELSLAIQKVSTYLENADSSSDVVAAGCLCEVEMNGGIQWFFVSGAGGGIQITIGQRTMMVITPGSPLGSRLLGLSSGNSFSLPSGVSAKLLSLN